MAPAANRGGAGEAEQTESLARVEDGGIPFSAQRRLRKVAERGSAFTSTLSVGEFALASGLGLRPLAQVMGSSIYHVGWQYLPWPQWGGSVSCELDAVSHAWDQARRRSLDRLTEEARLVGADAVVGVRVRRGEHDWASGTVDYVVVGTAVRFAGSDGGRWPILTDLSLQDYWKLWQAGFVGVGLVAATSVFFVGPSWSTRQARALTVNRNQELSDYTKGFYAARETVLRYLSSQADASQAHGIVGVDLDPDARFEKFHFTGYPGSTVTRGGAWSAGSQPGASDQERRGLMITIHAVGTAIREDEQVSLTPSETVVQL